MKTASTTATDASSQARSELERTQMLQNLGRLTAGIAHEINTPIQFIGDNLQFMSNGFNELLSLLDKYEILRTANSENGFSNVQHEQIVSARDKSDIEFISKEIPRAIAQSIAGVKRVSTMVGAMRDFSHIDERRFAPANLNKAIKNTTIILRNEIKYVADIEIDLDENLPSVMCSVDEMQQVFLNLIINAAHSIGEKIEENGGRGLIKVSSRVEGENAVFTISDTGKGISREIQEKIFEPFFTTKARGKGTGQGLSIVNSALKKHKGGLELESAEGVGTTFTIYVPIEGESRHERS